MGETIKDFSGGREAPKLLIQPNGDAKLSYAYNKTFQTKQVKGFNGAPSLINKYALLRYAPVEGDNKLLFDDASNHSLTSDVSKTPTIENILNWADGKKSTPYFLSDFLYSTYYGKIPNNYLVTLRRFPLPCVDNLTNPKNVQFPPSAQAVTWCSKETGNSLSEILGFNVGLAWEEMEAEVQKIKGNRMDGNSASPIGKIPGIDSVAKLTNRYDNPIASKKAQQNSDYWYDADDDQLFMNGMYGPINVIGKTMRRSRGLDFKQTITLKFHYSLNSYNKINPKIALIDIMCNMLALTYNSGQFWGGAIRYFQNHPEVPFLGDQDAFFNGNFSQYFESVAGDLKQAGGNLGDYLTKLFSDPVGALKNLAADLGNNLLGKSAADNHPGMLGIKSLLTGAPVGEWHLVVGNPMNPITMVGNLICKDAKFEFGDILGADDFPTELNVTITLEHGRGRDKSDVESMFNMGEGRIYYSPPGGEEQFNKSRSDRAGATDNGKGILSFHKDAEFDQYAQSAKKVGNDYYKLGRYTASEIKAAIGGGTGS